MFLQNFLKIGRVGLRAAIWRKTAEPPSATFSVMIGWCAISLAAAAFATYVEAGASPRFNFYGLNSLMADLAMSLVVVAAFAREGFRQTATAAFCAVAILGSLLAAALPAATDRLVSEESLLATFLWIAPVVWLLGACVAVIRTFSSTVRPWRGVTRIVAFCICLFAVWFGQPGNPIFKGEKFDSRYMNLWEFGRAALDGRLQESNEPPPRRVDRAAVEIAQPGLLEESLKRIVAPHPGVANVYGLGIAGWSDQDVFVKEVEGGMAALSRILPLAGHTLNLINHPDHAFSTPMASRQNVAAAVREIGHRMNKNDDVLVVFMTSHGSSDGLALRLSGALWADLSPEVLRDILDGEGITNRVVIVSACYSGVFLEPLKSPTTIVLTAADSEHTSFGCANDRDWTYFGDAFFNHALAQNVDLSSAFEKAKALIETWEKRDELPASNPQSYFGDALVRKLQNLYSKTPDAIPGMRGSTPDPPNPDAQSTQGQITGQ